MKIINVTGKYQYIYDNGKIIKKELSKEKGIITSFIHPKHVLSITKKFDVHLSEEEIYLEMEKYIYSYPGIDINKEYKSIFIPIKRDKNIIIEALLIDTKELNEIYENILKTYKYIDFISPSFLAWKEYYNLTKTEPKNDIFIYFGEEDAFLCGFSEGKYIFHKSINKIQTLAKLLNKDIDEVKEILKTKGLDYSLFNNEEEFNIIDKFFNEFFLKVFNIINFSINEYQISKFERIIFYAPFDIKKLFEQYKNYWELNSIEFKKSSIPTEYNHLEYLITLFNAKNYNEESVNLSIFAKPPAFYTTKSGQIFIFFILCFLVVSGYTVYKNYILYQKENQIKILDQKFKLLKARHDLEIKMVDKYKKENAEIMKDIDKYKNKIESISNKINNLYRKIKEPLFFNILAKISESMKKYSLKAKSIIKKQHHITIILVSNYNNTQEITLFMKDLLHYGYKNVKSTFISNKNNHYISRVDFDYE